jgi:thiosulfate dehydrogenase [quinone] large subunit
MKTKNIFNVLRVAMSFIFLWAFVDKLFGFGLATKPENAWISGGSPTTGFLANAVQGPLSSFFNSLSGVAIVDWLFMLGLLFIGLTFLFNKYVKYGAIAGMIMMALMYLALLFPENNPLIDDHIIYLLVFALFFSRDTGGN